MENVKEIIADLKSYLEKNDIVFDILEKKELIILKLFDDERNFRDKYILVTGLGGNIFRSNNSIWITEKQLKYLTENPDCKVLFRVSVKWYWSVIKSIQGQREDKENKKNGNQCLVDFNELKFLKKSEKKQNDYDFVHLHNHFEYSLLDGILNSKKWLESCLEKGFTSIALTDHGTLGGILDFYMEAKKLEIKPIFGYEAYITKEKKLKERGYDHLTLLAKNEAGWRTLLKINTYAQTKGFYYRPRFTYEKLSELNKGIIILTGCPVGKMYRLLVKEKFILAKNLYKYYCDCVGEENVYLELQIHNFKEKNEREMQDRFHINLISFFKLLKKEKFNPKIVLTNDCHYPNKEDFDVWNAVNRIQSPKDKDPDKKEQNFLDDLFLKTKKELFEDYKNSVLKDITKNEDFERWCNNTIEIAKKCNVEIPIGNHNLPSFPLEGTDCKTKEELFEKIIAEGFKEKIINKLFKNERNLTNNKMYKIYFERMNYEKRVIMDCGFIDYFLIIWDLVRYAKEEGIYVGLARGSVAGSLVALLMGITAVDPIKFNLLFERFLNETRVSGERAKEKDSLPDVDMDFESDARPKIKKYLEKKYGEKNVCSLATYGYLQLRSAIKDIGKVKNLDFKYTNLVTGKIYGNQWLDLVDALNKSQEVREFVEKFPDIMYLVERCMGQVRHRSVHPAGVIISPAIRTTKSGKIVKAKLDDFIPLRLEINSETKEKELVTEWEGEFVERRGLLKLDILGIRQLDIFKMINNLIEKNFGKKINFEEIPLDEKEVYEKFSSGDTEGVFQFKSKTQKEYQKLLKPENIEHLIASNALIRPGPMASQAHIKFVKIKNEGEQPEFDRGLEVVTKDTFGLYIYQEQIMQAMVVGGGMTLGEADIVRTVIKKFDKEKMKKFKDKFIAGIKRIHNYNSKDAENVWNKLMAFSSYGFNRSHSCSYAIMGYWCQWLKTYYPKEFWLANLEYANEDDRLEYINRIILSYSKEIDIVFPDINRSSIRFLLKGREIIWSLSHIKGVGEKAAIAILKARKNGEFKNLKDFYDRVEKRVVNKRTFVSLIYSGAFDKLCNVNPENAELRYEILVEYFKIKGEKEIPQVNDKNFFAVEFKRLLGINLVDWEEILKLNPKVIEDFYVPLDELNSRSDNEIIWVMGIIQRAYKKEFLIKTGKRKGEKSYFGKIVIQQNGYNCNITLWSDIWEKYESKIKIGSFIGFLGVKKDPNQYDSNSSLVSYSESKLLVLKQYSK